MKKLHEFWEVNHSCREETVTDLCDDSRRAVPGCMFAALSKNAKDRKNHVNEAISRGAKYILQECENSHITIENDVLLFFVKNIRAEWASIASSFFKSNFENIVAITGTNGKSSALDILRQIWLESGIKSASIGTLGVITAKNREKLPYNMTSPDCLELHKILYQLSETGIKNVAMEATSQGIEQHRVDAIKFAVCAFTNFTQDHLDYHQTFENYWNAKARLFAELASKESIFVVNDDDPYSKKIYAIAQDRGIECRGYGYNSQDVKIIDIATIDLHQQVRIFFYGKEFSFVLPLQGIFQVYNALCAASIAHVIGLNSEKIVEKLQKLQSINGRLELVSLFKSSHVYLDYAHTPDALQNAILSLKNHTKRRIITVFGCGGNRDYQKRDLMGRIAEKFSDVVIVTDDNPRDEDPTRIRKMILKGCRNAIEIADRKIAIEFAMEMLSDGDTLLIAGKGHETHQQVGSKLLEFSDRDVILEKVKTEK